MTDIAFAALEAGARAAARCAHCGEAVRGETVFCCSGCASAHGIIGAAGLGSFYDRLDSFRAHRPVPLDVDFGSLVRTLGGGVLALDLRVEGVDCGACVWLIESLLARDATVLAARVNLSTRRLALKWRGAAADANRHAALIAALGFVPAAYRPSAVVVEDDRQERELLRSLGVAGFAAANVMLLSVAVWSGHHGSMGDATRTLFHWLSAAIALPAVAYAGRPFFRSALGALRARRTNMDVPISIGVVLACVVSLYETWNSAEHAFFDSAITLLFFLLIGRYLDRRARGRARQAVQALLALSSSHAHVLRADGMVEICPAEELTPGDMLVAAAGERLAADGVVVQGRSSLDASLISGESLPIPVGIGDRAAAGMVNLGAPLHIRVTAAGERTVLAEIVRLVEAAERGRSRFIAISDRMARAYAPVVHLTALLTFLGWTVLGGLAWDRALVTATAVLIITCPCALALAVPVVQVVASTRLMKSGVLLLAPTALERFAEIDHVVLDKTGTLTVGRPELRSDIDSEALQVAAGMAASSRHPFAMALRRAAPQAPIVDHVVEYPGQGLAAGEVKLGSAVFCGVTSTADDGLSELWLSRPGRVPVRFALADRLRPDAGEFVDDLRRLGLAVELLSGDRSEAVEAAAAAAGIPCTSASVSPSGKVERLKALAATGKKVLMVGDGLNDAPALAAAHASISPASAAEASQNAADAIFQGDALAPIGEILVVARRADRLIRQNLALALAYNIAAVPLAIAGAVTPLIAAIAMSSSSLLVIANALRLGARSRRL